MSTVEMREKLQEFIAIVDEERMQALYHLFEQEIAAVDIGLSDELKRLIDDRIGFYANGGEIISSEEATLKTSKIIDGVKQRL